MPQAGQREIDGDDMRGMDHHARARAEIARLNISLESCWKDCAFVQAGFKGYLGTSSLSRLDRSQGPNGRHVPALDKDESQA
jgi:hypothetical protein